MSDELLHRLRFCRDFHGMTGYPENSKLFGEAAECIATLKAEVERLREALKPITEAAYGLSFGADWNNGTHVKMHRYRQKLLDAIPQARAALTEKGTQ
jgi:hypothetical protein